eukprot:gene24680-4079_t
MAGLALLAVTTMLARSYGYYDYYGYYNSEKPSPWATNQYADEFEYSEYEYDYDYDYEAPAKVNEAWVISSPEQHAVVTTGDPFEVVFDIPADYDMELAPEKATILLMKAKSNDYVASIGTFDVGTAVAVAKANKAATFTATVPENYGIEPGPYFLAIIDSVTHTIMGHCCGDQAKCNDGTYCDLDGTCFGCEWCAQSLDAIDGACPSKCGGVTKLFAGSTFPSDRSELESSGPVREPVEPGCPAFHRLVRNSNPEIDFSERSLAAPYDDARRMSERLASKVDLLAEEMAARPEHFGEYTLHVEQAYTVANKSVTTDISWHNAARAAKVTLIKLDERRRRARWEQRGGSANNISRLSLEAVAYSNRSWDAGSGSSLLRRRRQVACPAGYYDTTSGKAEYWSCGCACPGGCFTDGDCNCACKSINDAGETCTDVLVFRQTAGTYLSKEAWKSVNPDDPENDNY